MDGCASIPSALRSAILARAFQNSLGALSILTSLPSAIEWSCAHPFRRCGPTRTHLLPLAVAEHSRHIPDATFDLVSQPLRPRDTPASRRPTSLEERQHDYVTDLIAENVEPLRHANFSSQSVETMGGAGCLGSRYSRIQEDSSCYPMAPRSPTRMGWPSPPTQCRACGHRLGVALFSRYLLVAS
jgi:hypothetical protein